MASEKLAEVLSCPPAYGQAGGSLQSSSGASSKKSKALFGYSVAATTALIVVLVMGGVYYYRSIDVLQESIKKFQVVDNSGSTPVREEVEIDLTNNYAVFHLTGNSIAPGTFAALDYTKSMTGVYEPRSRRCYLIGGIRSEISDLQSLSNMYEKNITYTETSKKSFNYVIGDNYPVSDKKMLPGPLKSACTSLPVYWLEPAPDTTHGLQKRGSVTVKGRIGPVSITLTLSW
jgi:hypothetical protein